MKNPPQAAKIPRPLLPRLVLAAGLLILGFGVISLPADDPYNSWRKVFNSALVDYNDQKWRDAARGFASLSQHHECRDEARLNAGMACFRDEQYARAETFFGSLDSASSLTIRVRADFNTGNCAVLLKEYPRAREIYKFTIQTIQDALATAPSPRETQILKQIQNRVEHNLALLPRNPPKLPEKSISAEATLDSQNQHPKQKASRATNQKSDEGKPDESEKSSATSAQDSPERPDKTGSVQCVLDQDPGPRIPRGKLRAENGEAER
ncbi:MAG: hypothetical protein ACLFWL_09780 [Candidatus Brocadiia bacterium]